MANTHTLGRGRRFTARLLIILSVVLITVGVLANWMRLQVLDTETWVATSSAVIEDPAVQEAVAVYTVDELYANTRPDQLIAEALPSKFAILAPTISAAAREAAYRGAKKAMATDKVAEVWVAANTRAHKRFVRVVRGESKIVRETQSGIVLDLRPMLQQLAERVGVGERLVERLPEGTGTLTPRRSEELGRVLNVLQFLDTWGYWITFIGIGTMLVGLAMAGGMRRSLITWWSVGLIIGGLALRVAHGAIGPYVADLLTESFTWKAAVLATWTEVSSLLLIIANAEVLVGVFALLGAWLAGTSRPATAIARSVAPTFRDRHVATWVVFTIVMYLLFTLVPALARITTLGTFVLVVLAALGFLALQRQIVSAHAPGVEREPWLGATLGRWWADATEWWKSRGANDPVAQLERLASLHSSGAINDDEFAQAKETLIGSGSVSR